MKKTFVRHDVDPGHLAPLTEKQKVQLAALERQAENEIDHSDIAPLTEDFWKSAERGRFYKPAKTATTVV